MKARVRSLSPEMERAVREQVEHQIRIERGWMAHAVLMVAVWLMGMEHDWGSKRLNRLYAQLLGAWQELTAEYGYDCWYDKVAADLERWGVKVKTDASDLERQEHIQLAKQKVSLTPGQQAVLQALEKKCR